MEEPPKAFMLKLVAAPTQHIKTTGPILLFSWQGEGINLQAWLGEKVLSN
jgi:hypothetical protein